MVDGCRTYERPISLWCDQSGIERAEHLSDRIGNGARDPGRHEGIALARWRDVNDLEILVEGRSEHSGHLSNRVRRAKEINDLADLRRGEERLCREASDVARGDHRDRGVGRCEEVGIDAALKGGRGGVREVVL